MQVTFKEGAVPTFSGRPDRFHRKLNNNHLPTKSLLSNLFVRPCHSLADPPRAAWMDAGGQYADPACPLAAHAANNRGPCVFPADCITGPLTSGGHWPESANAITQRKPPNAAGSAGGRGEVGGGASEQDGWIGCDNSRVCYRTIAALGRSCIRWTLGEVKYRRARLSAERRLILVKRRQDEG